MKRKYLIFSLIVFIGFALRSQNSYVKDSIAIQLLYSELDTYYKDPASYKKRLEIILPKVDSLLEKKPDNKFLLLSKAVFNDYSAYFKGNELNFVKALALYEESEEILLRINETEYLSPIYRCLGYLWARQGVYDKEMAYYNKAYAIAKKFNNEEEILKIESDFGYDKIKKSYLGKGDFYDEAMGDFKRIAPIAVEKEFYVLAGEVYWNMALTLSTQGKSEETLPYLLKSEEYYNKAGSINGKGKLYHSLGEYYTSIGEGAKAIYYLKESIAMALKEKDSAKGSSRYRAISDAYKVVGNYKLAYENFKTYNTLNAQFRNARNTQVMLELENKLKEDKRAAVDSIRHIKEMEVQAITMKKKASTKFWTVVSSLLVILSILIIGYLMYRKKAVEQALRNEYLSDEVETKTEEINVLLTETIQHIKSKERIADNLQKLSQEHEGITLKSILADLRASKADNAKLMLIKQNIEQVNFSFIKSLKGSHPTLTKTDVEICSFIRLNLSRKEIAALRNTSIEAIKSSRFRLKKKLNLGADTSLDDYIIAL